jgi:predicted Zn-dependent peptidase
MLETPQQKAGILAAAELFSLPENYYQLFLEKIRESTIDEVFEVQKKYFKPENIVISCCGDSEYLQSELSQLGNIEIVENVEV